jgi:hypothetical protein
MHGWLIWLWEITSKIAAQHNQSKGNTGPTVVPESGSSSSSMAEPNPEPRIVLASKIDIGAIVSKMNHFLL